MKKPDRIRDCVMFWCGIQTELILKRARKEPVGFRWSCTKREGVDIVNGTIESFSSPIEAYLFVLEKQGTKEDEKRKEAFEIRMGATLKEVDECAVVFATPLDQMERKTMEKKDENEDKER